MTKYVIGYENQFEVTIGIKSDEETKKILHEINDFFSSAKQRLSDSNGCIELTVAKMIARQIIKLQAQSGMYGSTNNIIDKFKSGDIEGYYPIDGSFGIKLVDVGIEFDPSDLELDVSKECYVMPDVCPHCGSDELYDPNPVTAPSGPYCDDCGVSIEKIKKRLVVL